MCYFCNKEDILDVGWIERNNEYYSCCYDCGLEEDGEFSDRIPSGSVRHGATSPAPLTEQEKQFVIGMLKEWCVVCGNEVTKIKDYPYDFYCSVECEKVDKQRFDI